MATSQPTETITGARALYDTLRACGVTHLFGLDSPEPLYAEMDRAEMRPITVRDERAGAIMADAYARVSGRPGVCTAIRGPGATNLITGIAEAWASSTPVVAIVNDVNTALVGRNPIQEVDHLALFRPVTKWAVRLDRPERVAELTARAFSLATSGRPGPALVSCPDDVLTGRAPGARSRAPGARRYPSLRVAPDPAAIREAVAVLAEAGRVAIVAGGGVLISGAWRRAARGVRPSGRAGGDDAARQGRGRRDASAQRRRGGRVYGGRRRARPRRQRDRAGRRHRAPGRHQDRQRGHRRLDGARPPEPHRARRRRPAGDRPQLPGARRAWETPSSPCARWPTASAPPACARPPRSRDELGRGPDGVARAGGAAARLGRAADPPGARRGRDGALRRRRDHRLRGRQLQLAVGDRPARAAPARPAARLGPRLRGHRLGPARGHRRQAGRARAAGPVPHRATAPSATCSRSWRPRRATASAWWRSCSTTAASPSRSTPRSSTTGAPSRRSSWTSTTRRWPARSTATGSPSATPTTLPPRSAGPSPRGGRPCINVVVDPDAFPPIIGFERLRAEAPVGTVAH